VIRRPPRPPSTAYVAKGVAAVLIVGFFIWEFVALPRATHEALAVSLVGGVAIVVCLQATAFVQRVSFKAPGSSTSAQASQLAMRRKRLDPRRLPVSGFLTATVVLFAVPLTGLFWILKYSKGLGGAVDLKWFFLIVLALVGGGALLWLIVCGFLADLVGQQKLPSPSRWQRPPMDRSGADWDARWLPVGEPADALALVNRAALAAVLVDRLQGPLGPEFAVATSREDSILVRHSECERAIALRLARFRLDPPARAIALTCQQVLSEVQHFVSERLESPWPARPGTVDLQLLLDHAPARSRVSTADGWVHLGWQDPMGTVMALEPFALEDVLIADPDTKGV
jgi:hypothetical protein